MQTAYQILVAAGEDHLTEQDSVIWNSGKILSNSNIQVPYEGKKLQPATRYYWKVKFWDQHGTPSEYSDVAWFETGLFSAGDWKAQWIFNGIKAPENEADMYKDILHPCSEKISALTKPLKQPGCILPDWGILKLT